MKVYFKEDSHQYFSEDGKEYISVSKLAKKLEPFIDWDKKARKYAKDHDMSLVDVKRKWEEKRIKGSQAGTIYHALEEQKLLDDPAPLFYNVVCKKQPCEVINSVKWSYPLEKLQDNTVYPELMLYDHETLICGQSDKVIITNGTINIWDYKTDEEIKFEGFSNEWVKAAKYLPPVSHLDVSNGNSYSLKMSMYMYMTWKANKNLRIGDIIIEKVTLKRDSEGIPILKDGKPVVLNMENIKLLYRKNEVRDIFEFYKQGKL